MRALTDVDACLRVCASQPLLCPTQEEMDAFNAAVQGGDIVYHAAPFNFEVESMSPQLFEASLRMTKDFDTM